MHGFYVYVRAEPNLQNQHLVKFSGHKTCKSADIDFWNYHVTLPLSRDQRVTRLEAHNRVSLS